MPALWPTIMWSLVALAALLAGLAVFSDPARGRLRCPGGWRRSFGVIPRRDGCWYDMSGTVDADRGSDAPWRPVTCSECGRTWRQRRSLTRRRLRWRFLVVAGVLLVLAYPASVWPRVRAHGWAAGVPTWALVALAPVDEYAGSFFGGPRGGPTGVTSSPVMLELTRPQWERRFARWEVAWLCARLNAAVVRHPSLPPGDAVRFFPSGRIEDERWWGWSRPFTMIEAVTFGSEVVQAATQVAPRRVGPGLSSPRGHWWTRRGELQVIGGPTAFVSDVMLTIDSIDRATISGYMVVRVESEASGQPVELVAYDVSDISPARLVPSTRSGLRVGVGAQTPYSEGDPSMHQDVRRLSQVVGRVATSTWPTMETVHGAPGARAGLRGVLLVRNTPQSHALIRVLLEAIRRVHADRSDVVRGVPVGIEGTTASVLSLSVIASHPEAASATPQSMSLAYRNTVYRLENAMRRVGGVDSVATADRVAELVVLIGSAAELAAGERELASIGQVPWEELSQSNPPATSTNPGAQATPPVSDP